MKNLLILLFTFGFLIIYIPDSFSQEPDILFQHGLIKEEGEGNLEEAIEIYFKVVNDELADRNLRAKALMQVGICYEKLGKENAEQAYEKLVSEFSDQRELVTKAKEKLNRLSRNESQFVEKGIITRYFETADGVDYKYTYRVSPDGKNYLYINWKVHEIMMCNLETGETDSITQNNSWFRQEWSNPWSPVWAPDSKHVAYLFQSKNKNELRIVNIETKVEETIMESPNAESLNLVVFSKDGKSIFAVINDEENNASQQLIEISLEDKSFEKIADFGVRHGRHFRLSPSGDQIIFARTQENSMNKDIYIMLLSDKNIVQVTENNSDESNPVWSKDGSSILFLSNRSGTIDLYRLKLEKNNPLGNPTIIKRNLGKSVRILGANKTNNIYYITNNSRRDLYTLDLKEKFENNKTILTRITDQALNSGGMAPRYSKDGRYISYLNNRSNFYDDKNVGGDDNLGLRYYLGIYDTQTGEHRELKTAFYANHHSSDINEYVPDWSYDGSKILVHGLIKDKYQGGFFTIDVNTEEITPVLVTENSVGTKMRKAGRHMAFTKNPDVFYFTSLDWKNLMEFNIATKENKSVFYLEQGFFFRGFFDDYNKFVLLNSKGTFTYDFNSNKLDTLANSGWFLGWSPDHQYYYDNSSPAHMDRISITRFSIDGSTPAQSFSFREIFPNDKIWLTDIHPKRDEMVFDVLSNTGTDLYKLSGAFD